MRRLRLQLSSLRHFSLVLLLAFYTLNIRFRCWRFYVTFVLAKVFLKLFLFLWSLIKFNNSARCASRSAFISEGQNWLLTRERTPLKNIHWKNLTTLFHPYGVDKGSGRKAQGNGKTLYSSWFRSCNRINKVLQQTGAVSLLSWVSERSTWKNKPFVWNLLTHSLSTLFRHACLCQRETEI